MNIKKIIEENLFNSKLHREKGLFPLDHPNTGNVNVMGLWNKFVYINDLYEHQLLMELTEEGEDDTEEIF